MTNTKLFLLIGTSLSLIPHLTFAQCVATQDCAILGYTETSCAGGSGVKCPFGNKWACFKSDSEVCQQYGFTQTCTGEQIGVGAPCNGKYTECICPSGYAWNNSSQKCEYDYKTNCVIGALYYSDGTCSQDKLSSKTLLGVVISEKSDTEDGWIMTVSPIKTGIAWGGYGTDIPGLTNITSASNLTDIQASCTNTDIITAYGNSSTYPVAWAAKNYKPTGTPSGKSWCLPSGGLLNNLNNLVNFTKVNAGILIAGGGILGNLHTSDKIYNYERVWSSSELSGNDAWSFLAQATGSFNMESYDRTYRSYGFNVPSVRPVMAF